MVNTGEPILAELLEQVVATGGANILVSYSSIQEINEHLDEYDIEKYFDEVYDAEQVIEYGDTKSGVMSQYMSDKSGVEKILVIGDSLTDVEAGHEIGAKTCLFDPHLSFRQHVGNADLVAHQLIDIKDWLSQVLHSDEDAGYTTH